MATYKELYDSYFAELNNIADLLTKFVGTYKTLVDSANTLNSIALTKKSEIKKALKRATVMGDIIDDLIDAIEDADFCYLDYLHTKSQYISRNIKKESVLGELGTGLVLGSLLNNVPQQAQNVFIDGMQNMFKGKGKKGKDSGDGGSSNGGGNNEGNGGNNSGNNGGGNMNSNSNNNQGYENNNKEKDNNNEYNTNSDQKYSSSDDTSYYGTSKDDGFPDKE